MCYVTLVDVFQYSTLAFEENYEIPGVEGPFVWAIIPSHQGLLSDRCVNILMIFLSLIWQEHEDVLL